LNAAWRGSKKNCSASHRPDRPGQELIGHYEELRAWVLGRAGAPAPRSLAILLRMGLPGWMDAWSLTLAGVTEAAAVRSRSQAGTMKTMSSHELTSLLTEMVLMTARH